MLRKLIFHLALLAMVITSAHADKIITFDELAYQSANAVTIKGVTFGHTGSFLYTGDPDGPIQPVAYSSYSSPPYLTGDASGTLTFTFATAIRTFECFFALNGSPGTSIGNAATFTMKDTSGTTIFAFSRSATSLEGGIPQGSFGILGGGGSIPIKTITVTFTSLFTPTGPQKKFFVDNLRFITIDAPEFVSSSSASGVVGENFSFPVSVTNSPTSYTASRLPPGLTINPTTGGVSGKPTQTGFFAASVSATNSADTIISSLDITVSPNTSASIALSSLDQSYDGSPKPVSATTNPADLSVSFTYSGATAAPTNAGSYPVVATVSTPGYVASTTGLLVIAKASQILSFPIPANPFVSQPSPLSASASSGLPIIYSIVSGNATLSGSTITFNDTAAVRLRATVSENPNYYPISGEITITPRIANITASITLGSLSQRYDGSPKSVSAATTPAGLSVLLTYNGSGSAPTNAGSYEVIASIGTSGYFGITTGTLIVQKADQNIEFPAPANVVLNQSISLSASASSGLPVGYSILSGNATLSGSNIVFTDATSVRLRANQSGNSNYNSASAEITVQPGKQAQTITFSAIEPKKNTDATFAIAASSSSGLPVTLTLVSGPASLDGNLLTLNGASGAVVIRSSQAGDSNYQAAADVIRSFPVQAVAAQIYFGSMGNGGKGGDFAVYYSALKRTGKLLGFITDTAEGFAVDFVVDANNQFVVSSNALAATNPTKVTTSAKNVAFSSSAITSPAVRTFRGKIDEGNFTGSIDGTGITLSASIVAPNGSTSALTGYYGANSLYAASGSTSLIVAANGQAYALSSSADLVTGAFGTITSAGAFSVQSANSAVMSGTLNPSDLSLSGSIQRLGSATVSFSGLSSTIVPVQHLVNLSVRGMSGSGSEILTSGFVITGPTPKPVLLRAVGPGLIQFGVNSVLSNPRLRLFRGSDVIAENDDWGATISPIELSNATTNSGAFTLAAGSKDAALYATLDPGAYTLQVFDPAGSGIALAEVYDASATSGSDTQHLVNLSARGYVGTGDSSLIGGLVVTGNSPKRVLVRGVGAGLAAFGVPGAVSNPLLKIYRGSTIVVENDDWDSTATAAQSVIEASAKSGAFTLTAGSKDAAVVTTLPPGAYTVIVSGSGASAGVALLEIYEVPE